jgi:hypothetical protein
MSYIILFILMSFPYRHMIFSTRNIGIALLAVVLGTYLLMPKADAAGHCAGSMCLQCNEKIFLINESATKVGLNDHLCDISFGNYPCDLKNNSNPKAAAVIVSVRNSDRQVAGASSGFTGYNPSSFLNAGGNDKAARFHIASGTVPIYLQNRSLLC